jgi:4'-phosphopantetheinyl transferase EntD
LTVSALREAVVVVLAFAAGAGAYIGTLKNEPVWPQDYFGAIGSGALTALAKMIPTHHDRGRP